MKTLFLKIIIGVLVLVFVGLIGVVGFSAYQKGFVKYDPTATPIPTRTMIDDPQDRKLGEETQNDSSLKADGVLMGEIKQIEITASNFKYEPEGFAVNLGDTVTVTFKNTEGFHDFTIEELGVKTKTLEAGGEEQVTFVANKKGSFQFFCSVGQHRAMGMAGVIQVN